jgi:hypothetical protein
MQLYTVLIWIGCIILTNASAPINATTDDLALGESARNNEAEMT